MTTRRLIQNYLDGVNRLMQLPSHRHIVLTHSASGYMVERVMNDAGGVTELAGCMTVREAYFYARGLYEGLALLKGMAQ